MNTHNSPKSHTLKSSGRLLGAQLQEQVLFLCSEMERGEQLPGNPGVHEFPHEELLWRFVPERSTVLFVHHQTSITLSTHRLILVSSANHLHLGHRDTTDDRLETFH